MRAQPRLAPFAPMRRWKAVFKRGKIIWMPNSSSKPAWQTIMEMLERLPEGRRLPSLAYWEQKSKETADLEILRGIKEVRRRLENRSGLRRDGSMSNPKLMRKYAAQAQRLAMGAKDPDTREALLADAKRFRNLAKLSASPTATPPPKTV